MHPARWSDHTAYMSNITKAQKFVWPSWVVYDQNFRQEAANTPGMTWAKVDPSIYAQCFTGMAANAEGWCRQCHSIEHPSDRCPDAPPWDPVPHQGQSKGASIRKRPWPVLPSTSTKRATPSGPSDFCQLSMGTLCQEPACSESYQAPPCLGYLLFCRARPQA